MEEEWNNINILSKLAKSFWSFFYCLTNVQFNIPINKEGLILQYGDT